VLVVGPSGAGKDTLLRLARSACAGDGDVVFPRRVVTRPASEAEDNQELSPAAFRQAHARGDFALHWEAHGIARPG
jgi:ribose 1,5-bisphosphokinase